jgi:uncharacterized protein involved in exopolysaccharide biosynthesis
LQSVNESTNRAQERRLLIERQIADTREVPLPAPPVGTTDNPVPMGTAQQLELARTRLALILQRYTPNHPEVVSLQRLIADLSLKLEGEVAVGAIVEPKRPLTPAETAQQKRILELQAELAVIDYQLSANKAEAARLQRAIGDYQSKVDVVPTRESELVELTRDYGTMQTAYTNLLVKRENSMLAANLERRQIGEQFKLLDTASLPQRPYNQAQRLGVMFSGAGGGLLLGLLVVALLEYRDQSFKAEEEVLKAVSVPVLALIPVMSSDVELRAVAQRSKWIDAAGTAVVLAAAAVVVLWRLRS